MGIFSVANAVKVTQACIYKSASAGLLSSINCNHKYCQIQYAHACVHFLIQNTTAFQHKHTQFGNTFGYKSVEKYPCIYRLVNTGL